MADICDQADEAVEALVAKGVAIARAYKSGLTPCGKCYNCLEPLESDKQLFCDCDCESDYQRIKYANSQRVR